jgi:CelD/BcsL family acetyltransferase involved in cellulose biosynthesis
VNIEVIEGHPFPGPVAAEWEALLRKSLFPNPFLAPIWHEIWLKHFGKSLRTKVMVVREGDGNPLALGAFSQNAGAGDRESLELLGAADVYDYRDLVFSRGREEEACGLLGRVFEEGPWGLLDFRGISEFSPTLKFLPPILRSRNFQVTERVEEISLYLDLPGRWEEFLEGLDSKDRHELRRKMRRLEKEVTYEFSEVRAKTALEGKMGIFLELHRKSRKDKAEFMTAEMENYFREVAIRFCEREWLNLSFLKVGGREVAAFFSFQFQGTEYVYNSGYDPEFGRWSPGIVLAARCIRRAIEGGTALFHFLRGREEYKYHLGGKEERIYRIRAVKK